MRTTFRRRVTAASLGALATVAACSSDGTETVGSDEVTAGGVATEEGGGDDPSAATTVESDAGDVTDDDVATPDDADAATIDLTAMRDDVDCTDEGLGADDVYSFTAAHYVVDGVLGALCNGNEDERLIDVWDALATIAPRGQLGDLGAFTAFEEAEAGDEVTLAFVQPIDADGTLFQMSVGLDEVEADPDEALLTMAHEFSHVFTAIPSQIDRTVEAAENCATYDNGEGCFLEGSLVVQWIDAFWVDYIDGFDPLVEASGAEGQERCSQDAGFLGPYAASDPEEDFAESFSAYVFDVEAATPEQQERIDWMAAQPGLAEFRERAEAGGLTPVRNDFEVCGVS